LSGHIAVGADPLSFAGKLGGIQATWSGNSFTIDIDQATDTTTNGEHSTGRLRGHLMGTLNVAKKTLTMSGEITEDTRLENGNLGSDTLQTWKNVSHLSAADIPLITATGGGADPQDIKFRIEGQKNIVSHRVAGDASSKHTRDFKGGTRSDQTATGLAPETPGMQTPSVEIIFSKTSYQDFINHVLNKP
jgi:hypothetical protein